MPEDTFACVLYVIGETFRDNKNAYLGSRSFRRPNCSSGLTAWGGACGDDGGVEGVVVSSLSSKLLLRADPILFPRPWRYSPLSPKADRTDLRAPLVRPINEPPPLVGKAVVTSTIFCNEQCRYYSIYLCVTQASRCYTRTVAVHQRTEECLSGSITSYLFQPSIAYHIIHIR